MDTRKARTIYGTVPVEPGQLVSRAFPNAKALRIVRNGGIRAYWQTGDRPGPSPDRAALPTAMPHPVLLDATDVWFDFRDLETTRTYPALVVEISSSPNAVYAAQGPSDDTAYQDHKRGAAQLAIGETRALWTSTFTEENGFQEATTGWIRDRFLSGIVTGDQTFTLRVVVIHNGVSYLWGSGVGKLNPLAAGQFFYPLDHGFQPSIDNSAFGLTAAGGGGSVVGAPAYLQLNKRLDHPRGALMRLDIVNTAAGAVNNAAWTISTVSR